MQTALLARELARLMRWDGDTTRAVNLHFNSIAELHHTLDFIGDLSMEDVLKSVLLATVVSTGPFKLFFFFLLRKHFVT